VTVENAKGPISDAQVPEKARQEEGQGASPGETGRPLRAGRRGRVKWVCAGVIGVISLGLALKWAYPLLSIHLNPFTRSDRRDVTVRPEGYESVRPFFIPMPPGRDKVVARVDIRVKWDRLTGARFKRDSVSIRQRIYLYLKDFERWSDDMEANRQVLEKGIGRIFRQVLGVGDVDVLLEEIQYVRIEPLSLGTFRDPRENDDRTSTVMEVWPWMNSPMSAAPSWESIPPARWWG